MTDRDPSWTAYPNTILEFHRAPPLRVDLRRAVSRSTIAALGALGLGNRFAVVTPCNRGGIPAPEGVNAKLVAELQAELERRGFRFVRADGVSPDGQHREPGFAVNVPLAQSARLARALEQSAFFWFDGETFWLEPVLVAGTPVRLPLGGPVSESLGESGNTGGAVYLDPNNRPAINDLPGSRPRSARLVAEVSWSWSPAHSRTDVYHLSSDRARSRWILWVHLPDFEEESEHPIAFCPKGELSPKDAAGLLLAFAWQKEREVYDSPVGSPHEIGAEGLLSAAEIRSLGRAVWPNDRHLEA